MDEQVEGCCLTAPTLARAGSGSVHFVHSPLPFPGGKSWVIPGDHCAYCWEINSSPGEESGGSFVGGNL